jgi:hypothetical protein
MTTMTDPFRLIMISAMYENGGNTTHRLLDGHPQLYTYPFESQLGTNLVRDHLSSLFPVKYRWPVFDLSRDAASDYENVIDEECKVRMKTPHVSKFRDSPFEMRDRDRKESFIRHASEGPRTRGRIIEGFFRATFEAWKDLHRSGRETTYVGYSPILIVDAMKILEDLPRAHVLHVVRNPWSAYADTKKRAVPLSLEHYMTGWTICQDHALLFQLQAPQQVHVLRYEDIIGAPEDTLGRLLAKVGLESSPTLKRPSWNGKPLESVHPWGTIRVPTPEANLATARELSLGEREEVRQRAGLYLNALGYEDFLVKMGSGM